MKNHKIIMIIALLLGIVYGTYLKNNKTVYIGKSAIKRTSDKPQIYSVLFNNNKYKVK